MIASRMNNPYRAQQIDALAKELVRKGFRPMLFCIDEDNNVEQLLSILLNYRVSGVVITSDAPPREICDECTAMGVPLVLVDRADDLPFVDRINGDDARGGALAAEALAAAGHKRAIAVRQDSLGYSGQARIAAFVARAGELGLETEIIPVTRDEFEGGAEAAEKIIGHLDQRPGVFCPSDTCALGLLDTLRHGMGVAIPEQLSLVGYDDIPQAEWTFAKLTTVRQPVDNFARATVELLQERIKDPEAPPRSRVLEVDLVERATVGPAGVER